MKIYIFAQLVSKMRFQILRVNALASSTIRDKTRSSYTFKAKS